MDNYLENSYKDVYKMWKSDPSPKNTSLMLDKVKPVIDRSISAHVGFRSPNLTSQARRLAVKAFKSYDPNLAGLNTHLMNQLQSLKRIARKQTQIITVPERVSLDQGWVSQIENELRDEYGREPNSQEIADKAGISLKRLSHIRRFRQPVSEGMFMDRFADEESSYVPASTSLGEQHDPWVDLVYSDLDATNKKILEHSLGLYGSKQMSNQQIANKLSITPGAVSQRKLVIQKKLNEAAQYSPFL